MYLRGLLTQMGHKFDKPTDLMVDNSGAVALSKHRTSCNHSRHVSRRDLKVRAFCCFCFCGFLLFVLELEFSALDSEGVRGRRM